MEISDFHLKKLNLSKVIVGRLVCFWRGLQPLDICLKLANLESQCISPTGSGNECVYWTLWQNWLHIEEDGAGEPVNFHFLFPAALMEFLTAQAWAFKTQDFGKCTLNCSWILLRSPLDHIAELVRVHTVNFVLVQRDQYSRDSFIGDTSLYFKRCWIVPHSILKCDVSVIFTIFFYI